MSENSNEKQLITAIEINAREFFPNGTAAVEGVRRSLCAPGDRRAIYAPVHFQVARWPAHEGRDLLEYEDEQDEWEMRQTRSARKSPQRFPAPRLEQRKIVCGGC